MSGSGSAYRRPAQRTERPAGVSVQIGVHDRADREGVVEALLVRGERQQHRPPTGAGAAQPHPAHLDPVFAHVAAAGDEPLVGVGHAGEHVGLADLPPRRGRRPHRRAAPAVRAPMRPACAIRWSRPDSASTSACQSGPAPTRPARRRTRFASAPARASTRRAASSSHVPYRASAGSARPVRIRSSSQRSSCVSPSNMRAITLVTRSIEIAPIRRVRRHSVRSSGSAPGAGAGRSSAPLPRSRVALPPDDHVPSIQDVDRLRSRARARPPPRTQSSRSANACLHGSFRLGQVQRQADPDVVDRRLVRLGPRAATAPPQRSVVCADRRPSGGDSERVGSSHRTRRRRDCGHLFDGPPMRLIHGARYRRGLTRRDHPERQAATRARTLVRAVCRSRVISSGCVRRWNPRRHRFPGTWVDGRRRVA